MAKKLVRFIFENAFFDLQSGGCFETTHFDAQKRICHFRFWRRRKVSAVRTSSKTGFWQMKKM
tara:strand:- start:139 stop:327 length:189 start_codon:yes stop_codon:yes gene_type:complete